MFFFVDFTLEVLINSCPPEFTQKQISPRESNKMSDIEAGGFKKQTGNIDERKCALTNGRVSDIA